VTQSDPSIFCPVDPNAKMRELVAEILYSRAKPEKFVEYFHDDAVCHIVGVSREYAFSGSYRGREQLMAMLRRIDGEVELSDHRVLNLVVDGDNAALRRSVVVRHHGTSAVTRLIIGNLLRFRDFKVVEAYEYADTCWLRRLSGESE
jgi:ketosteroid isomerase-like protein